MDKVEREKAVADAIILERATRVLERRKPGPDAEVRERQHHELTVWELRDKARELRQEAEEN